MTIAFTQTWAWKASEIIWNCRAAEDRLQKRRDADRWRRARLRAEKNNEEECLWARRRIHYALRRSEETVESREDKLQARRVCDARKRNESHQKMTFQTSFYFNMQLSIKYAHPSLALLQSMQVLCSWQQYTKAPLHNPWVSNPQSSIRLAPTMFYILLVIIIIIIIVIIIIIKGHTERGKRKGERRKGLQPACPWSREWCVHPASHTVYGMASLLPQFCPITLSHFMH